MLFQVHMIVSPPTTGDMQQFEQLKVKEKEYAHALQQDGRWRHIWRIVGCYENTSIFDVESNEALHDILTQLPLFSYLTLSVTPLCRHPSSIHQNDR